VGLTSFVPDVQAGIYKIGKGGGEGTLFAKDAKLSFPNALALDEGGALFATDSGSGTVFRIDAQGRAERWISGDLLLGSTDNCGPGLGAGFDIGANGLVVERAAVYIVNNDKATLIEIPRDVGGKAGAPRVIAGPDCENLAGADGLTRAPDGSFTVALNRQNRIVRVTPAGAVQTLVSGAPLDFPASVVYGADHLYVTNFALANASAGKPATPALLKLRQ
jgi:sugar lactone lactonase YvrE